jgi:sulfatase maturation enzyme AslB (radical SAM superfamily)
MFTAQQYRAKAIEYSKLLKSANGPDEVHDYHRLERSFTELADNAQWLADNHDKTAHATMYETASVTLDSADYAAQINAQQ